MHQSNAMAGYQVRVVVLDGDETMRRDAVGALQAMLPAATTSAAGSGRQAMDILHRSACDLLLVDIGSALDLAASAEDAVGRLARSAAGALIVVMSDGRSVSAALSAMQSGAHEVIARPIETDEFASRLAALARRHGRSRLAPQGAEWLGTGPGNPALRHAGAERERKVLPMWRQEQMIIEDAIRHFSGNITMAAAALELSPSTIYRKRQAWAEMDGRKGAA